MLPQWQNVYKYMCRVVINHNQCSRNTHLSIPDFFCWTRRSGETWSLAIALAFNNHLTITFKNPWAQQSVIQQSMDSTNKDYKNPAYGRH